MFADNLEADDRNFKERCTDPNCSLQQSDERNNNRKAL